MLAMPVGLLGFRPWLAASNPHPEFLLMVRLTPQAASWFRCSILAGTFGPSILCWKGRRYAPFDCAQGDKSIVCQGDKSIVCQGDKSIVCQGDKSIVCQGERPSTALGATSPSFVRATSPSFVRASGVEPHPSTALGVTLL
jgi:hypothetical protein